VGRTRFVLTSGAGLRPAQIKPVDPSAFHTVGINVFPGGRVVLSGMPLKALIGAAFRLSYWQIAGGDG
jgi:hypothetical protein